MQITANTIFLGIAIISSITAAIMFFRKPQEIGERRDAVLGEKFSNLKEEITNLKDNHIHTLDTKLDAFINSQNIRNESFSNKLVEITTMLNERLPIK